MKLSKKIRIFALVTAFLMVLSSLAVFAEDKNFRSDDFMVRAEKALQGTITGLLMVFAVLALLWGVVSISKIVFYDIPRKRDEANKQQKSESVTKTNNTPSTTEQIPAPVAVEQIQAQDDGELAAVITAAVAAMIESGDYKNEFANGFRVVSFKRSAKSAWNRK